MYVRNDAAQNASPPAMRALRRRPPMARMPAREIMIANEHGLNPSTNPAAMTVARVTPVIIFTSADSTTLPVTGTLTMG